MPKILQAQLLINLIMAKVFKEFIHLILTDTQSKIQTN